MKPSVLLSLLFSLVLLCACHDTPVDPPSEVSSAAVPQFNADSALRSVTLQCDFGSRVPGTAAHRACGDWITATFTRLGLRVLTQSASLTRYDGVPLDCRNIIALDTAASPRLPRLLLASHWDSRPWADNDPDTLNRRTPILGANDGASGVAVMIEIARLLHTVRLADTARYAVDFICFDAEDAGVPEWDTTYPHSTQATWCLGSQYWAAHPHRTDYDAAILLDMVGAPSARFCRESHSVEYASALVDRVWQAARRAGYSGYFPTSTSGYVTDDHLYVNRLTPVRMIDIVPYQTTGDNSFSPTWHTLDDTPRNISPSTLQAVGQTLLEFIFSD